MYVFDLREFILFFVSSKLIFPLLGIHRLLLLFQQNRSYRTTHTPTKKKERGNHATNHLHEEESALVVTDRTSNTLSAVRSLCKYNICNWGLSFYHLRTFIFWRVQLLWILFVHHLRCWPFCFFDSSVSIYFTLILIFNPQIMLIWIDKLLGLYSIQNIYRKRSNWMLLFFEYSRQTRVFEYEMKPKSIGAKEKKRQFWYWITSSQVWRDVGSVWFSSQFVNWN